MGRRLVYLGITVGLAIASVAGISLLPACYTVPQPTCGFQCGPAGACPANYTCSALDSRCHLDGSDPANVCLTIDGGVILPPDGPMADAVDASTNVAPTVTAVTPAAAATNVALDAMITATFDEEVVGVSAGTFFVRLSGTPITGTVSYDSVARVAQFHPTQPLLAGVMYTASLTQGITDVQGLPIAGQAWQFSTIPDTVAPAVVSTDPAANATGVGDQAVSVTFSEEVQNVSAATFTVSPGTGTVQYFTGSKVAVFTPSAPLPTSTTITVTLAASITDAFANPLAAGPVSWQFTTGTDTAAPTVVTTSPAGGASNVPVTTTLDVTFSEPVIGVSATSFMLFDALNNSYPGTVTTSGGGTQATFTPAADLPANKTMFAVLTGTISDGANALHPVTFAFTTAP